ncbi:MAG: hypothetical protein ACREIA_24480 [Opitutaceae bacterium]
MYGREQHVMDYHGGALSDRGGPVGPPPKRNGRTRSVNEIRGVAKYNDLGRTFYLTTEWAFGDLTGTGYTGDPMAAVIVTPDMAVTAGPTSIIPTSIRTEPTLLDVCKCLLVQQERDKILPMTPEEGLIFVETKLNLACQNIETDATRNNIERMFGVVIEDIKQNKSATQRRIRNLDKQLDVMLRVIAFPFQKIDRSTRYSWNGSGSRI